MSAPRIAHRAEYLLARGLEAAMQALPERLADRLAGALGSTLHTPLGIRRATVYENLRRAYPEASPSWIEATARRAYRHLAGESVAMMRLPGLTRAAVVARTEMIGWEEFAEAAGEGRGVVLVTGHFGNWELGAASVAARGLPISAIVKRQSNPLVDARLDAARRSIGVATIDAGAARRQVPRYLNRGGVVAIVADQDAREAGVWVPFLGVPSSTARGPALFSLRLDVPLFFGVAYRLPEEVRYRVVLERVECCRTGELAEDVVRLTAAFTERLEAAVRSAPEQYFWFHRRWKTRPPAELEAPPPGSSPSGGDVVQLEKPR